MSKQLEDIKARLQENEKQLMLEKAPIQYSERDKPFYSDMELKAEYELETMEDEHYRYQLEDEREKLLHELKQIESKLEKIEARENAFAYLSTLFE